MSTLTEQIANQHPQQRRQTMIDVFTRAFQETVEPRKDAWRVKFRKMASSPFAFYRGSAPLFYTDLVQDDDPFLDHTTSRVWVQGDMHAENFGTYINSEGVLVLDVNDFDEAYVAPFTWDIKRLVASLDLIGYQKALSDDVIQQMIATLVHHYVDQIAEFTRDEGQTDFALTLDTTSGKLLETLQEARMHTRIDLLQSNTYIENYERRFMYDQKNRPLDADTEQQVRAAFERYLETIPTAKRQGYALSYRLKDVVLRKGVGIGSAGLPSYTLLLEGPSQALENDILLYMKQGQPAALSQFITDTDIRDYFEHHGHRTAVSQLALQANTDRWLGHTTLQGVGQVVDEVSPYEVDLDWENINELDDILEVLGYLGQATAKIHSVSDEDSDQTLVSASAEHAIHECIAGRKDEFVAAMVDFGQQYGAIVRNDHRLFIDAFRNHQIMDL